jgi:hypothetical protein
MTLRDGRGEIYNNMSVPSFSFLERLKAKLEGMTKRFHQKKDEEKYQSD